MVVVTSPTTSVVGVMVWAVPSASTDTQREATEADCRATAARKAPKSRGGVGDIIMSDREEKDGLWVRRERKLRRGQSVAVREYEDGCRWPIGRRWEYRYSKWRSQVSVRAGRLYKDENPVVNGYCFVHIYGGWTREPAPELESRDKWPKKENEGRGRGKRSG